MVVGAGYLERTSERVSRTLPWKDGRLARCCLGRALHGCSGHQRCMRVSAQTVGLRGGRSGLDSEFPLRSLFREGGVRREEGEGRKQGRTKGMVRDEGHLVMICVH